MPIVKLKNDSEFSSYHLSNNKVYSAKFKKTKYRDFYLIKCDDGLERSFSTEYFIPIDDMRQDKLNELGI